jgi:hypothetical protein
MSAIESNISANQFVTQANNAIDGLNISTDDSSVDVIDALNEAFDGVEGRRVITDKYAGGFIDDVNYNIDLMGSGGEEPVVPETFDLPDKPRLLFMGNSLTLDAIMYLPFILKAHGINAIVGITFRHGKSVEWYLDNWDANNDSSTYLYVCDNTKVDLNTGVPQWHDFGTAWDSAAKEWKFSNPKAAVTATNATATGTSDGERRIDLNGHWDLISIQSFGYESYQSNPSNSKPLEDTYHNLVAAIVAALGTNEFRLGFTIPTHTIALGTPKGIMGRTSNFVAGNNENRNRKYIDVVFPSGTGIFNARTHSEMRSLISAAPVQLSTNFPGRKLYGDLIGHSNEGMACYIAALAVAETLFRKVNGWDGNAINGNEILPAVNGVYPSNTDWENWSKNAKVRNPNGQDAIFGLDGSGGAIVPNGIIGSISRQWATWFATKAADNPYSLVTTRIDGGSTNVAFIIQASHCHAVVGAVRNPNTTPGVNPPASSYPYYPTDSVWIWIIPDDGYAIDEAWWTTLWRRSEGSENEFKVNFSTEGNNRKLLFQNMNDDIFIYATATPIS